MSVSDCRNFTVNLRMVEISVAEDSDGAGFDTLISTICAALKNRPRLQRGLFFNLIRIGLDTAYKQSAISMGFSEQTLWQIVLCSAAVCYFGIPASAL